MPIQLIELEEDEISILGSKYKRGEIYRFKDVPLVTVEANKNRDIISERDAMDIASTLPLRPISDDHQDRNMIGIFTEARYVPRPDGFDKPQVFTDGLIYAKHTSKETIEGFRAGNKSLSIEASADKASCTICGKWFDDQAEYCKHLKSKGVYGGYRRFTGMRSTGGGVVDEPAGSNTRIRAGNVSILASYESEIEGREFSDEERKELAKEDKALPDGSYPIVTEEDCKNAVRAWGRGGATEADKAHIIKRAKDIGAESCLPEDWIKAERQAIDAAEKIQKEKDMSEQEAAIKPADDVVAEEKQKMQKEVDELKAKLDDALAKLQQKEADETAANAKITELNTEVEAKKVELQASLESNRKMFLVNAGIFTEEEWVTQKETVMAMDNKGVELFASVAGKTKRPIEKPVMLQGAVQNPLTPAEPKPKLVLK